MTFAVERQNDARLPGYVRCDKILLYVNCNYFQYSFLAVCLLCGLHGCSLQLLVLLDLVIGPVALSRSLDVAWHRLLFMIILKINGDDSVFHFGIVGCCLHNLANEKVEALIKGSAPGTFS